MKNQGVTSEGYIAAILAVLEPLAFILAIFMTNMAVSKQIRAKRKSVGDDSSTDIDVGLNETKTKLSKVLYEDISSLPGVRFSESSIGLKYYKYDYRWARILD